MSHKNENQQISITGFFIYRIIIPPPFHLFLKDLALRKYTFGIRIRKSNVTFAGVYNVIVIMCELEEIWKKVFCRLENVWRSKTGVVQYRQCTVQLLKAKPISPEVIIVFLSICCEKVEKHDENWDLFKIFLNIQTSPLRQNNVRAKKQTSRSKKICPKYGFVPLNMS